MLDQPVQLNDRLMSSLAVGKVFKEHTKRVNSMDFTVDGTSLTLVSVDILRQVSHIIGGRRLRLCH
jgi:hypothetical protein